MKINNRKGISLIVLVITIIVIIILAGAIILSLSNNNPIDQAVKATYLSDVRNFQNELNLYKTKQFAETKGNYELTKLQADETSITYNGAIDNTKTITDIITSLGMSDKYDGKFKIVNGELIFQGTDINEQNWASEIGIQVVTAIPDTQPPVNPTISLSPSAWTNGDVSVTITYSLDSNVKEYSLDGTTWLTYTVPVVVSSNNTIIYARGKDLAGNESGHTSITVTNIDKILPTVAYGTNGGSAASQVSTSVTASDTGGSLLNTTSLQYVWSNQNTVAPGSGWVSFTNGATLTKSGTAGTYYLWIKASDNAGNIQTTVSNSFVILQNFATGSTPIVSASYPTSPAINGIDGSLATQWNSGTTTGWYTLDLLSAKSLSYININTDASSSSVTFSVYGSNNNSTWTLLATSTTPPRVWQKVNITGSYRYVKVNADNWNGSWVAIQELEVY